MGLRARLVILTIVAVIIGGAIYFFVSEIWQDVKLTVYDQVAQPLERGELIAKLEQQGPFGVRREMKGYPVRFWSSMFNVTEVHSGENGVAKVRVQFPSGLYGPTKFNVEFLGASYRKPAAATGRVFFWPAEALVLVVDVDHAIFNLNQTATARSQADSDPSGAAEALTELSNRYYIAYVTACEDAQLNDTQVWLREKGFPDGPCFCRGLYPFQTQEGFKQQLVTDLKGRFPRAQVGVGDRAGDAKAYLASGLQAFIIDPDQKQELPGAAVRVDSWKAIVERLRP